MHCTAFTSFPKPLALSVTCDTAIFHHSKAQETVITQKALILCTDTPQQNPTAIK